MIPLNFFKTWGRPVTPKSLTLGRGDETYDIFLTRSFAEEMLRIWTWAEHPVRALQVEVPPDAVTLQKWGSGGLVTAHLPVMKIGFSWVFRKGDEVVTVDAIPELLAYFAGETFPVTCFENDDERVGYYAHLAQDNASAVELREEPHRTHSFWAGYYAFTEEMAELLMAIYAANHSK